MQYDSQNNTIRWSANQSSTTQGQMQQAPAAMNFQNSNENFSSFMGQNPMYNQTSNDFYSCYGQQNNNAAVSDNTYGTTQSTLLSSGSNENNTGEGIKNFVNSETVCTNTSNFKATDQNMATSASSVTKTGESVDKPSNSDQCAANQTTGGHESQPPMNYAVDQSAGYMTNYFHPAYSGNANMGYYNYMNTPYNAYFNPMSAMVCPTQPMMPHAAFANGPYGMFRNPGMPRFNPRPFPYVNRMRNSFRPPDYESCGPPMMNGAPIVQVSSGGKLKRLQDGVRINNRGERVVDIELPIVLLSRWGQLRKQLAKQDTLVCKHLMEVHDVACEECTISDRGNQKCIASTFDNDDESTDDEQLKKIMGFENFSTPREVMTQFEKVETITTKYITNMIEIKEPSDMDITNDLSDSQGSSDVVDTFEDSSKTVTPDVKNGISEAEKTPDVKNSISEAEKTPEVLPIEYQTIGAPSRKSSNLPSDANDDVTTECR